MATLAPTAMHHRAELIERAAEAPSAREAFAAASTRLRRLVPFDACVWAGLDPATTLPTAPTRAENMASFGGIDACARLWELEYVSEDVNRYRELARAALPAAGLHRATGGEPARSARFRELLRPSGWDDELRAVLRTDGCAWASVTLFRSEGRPPFGDAEAELLGGLSRPLAEAVRDHARPAPEGGDPERGPGLLVFDPAGALVSINDDARAWLEELAGDLAADDAFGAPLPMLAVSALMRARARGTARARLRSGASGRWLVCHASCLRGADGEIGNTALVIEHAKASEIAPIVAEAYELSPRERHVTQLVARGLGTADIAAELHVSPHTVRDHVKASFEKVGVSSRGELVARLFADHYAPAHFAGEVEHIRN